MGKHLALTKLKATAKAVERWLTATVAALTISVHHLICLKAAGQGDKTPRLFQMTLLHWSF